MKAFNVWVTKKCNFRCSYCYEGIEKESDSFLQEDVQYLVVFIKKMSEKEEDIVVNFHGGEPLLNLNAIIKICEEIKKESIIVFYTLTTNASLLDDLAIEKLKKYNISISISLDGVKHYHDLNRIDAKGNGTYNGCVNNAIAARNKGMNIRVRMTVTSSNYIGLVENVMHIINMGFNTIVAVPDFFDSNWKESDIENIKSSLIILNKKLSNKDVTFVFYEERLKCKGKCKGGVEECNIDTDLLIYPCTYSVGDKKWCIGSVRDGINEEKIKLIDRIGNINNVECSDCKLEPYCMSTRCKIINDQLTGGCNRVSPVICAFEHLIYNVYH